jgi:sigma-54 dependent transcriptional regulator, acetoin dehydrogenase operon transcriptional activator AcoR
LRTLSAPWEYAMSRAVQAMSSGKVVAAIGEPGSGRATLLARRTYPRARILSATAPASPDMDTGLGLWTPELGKAHTAVIVREVDALPTSAATAGCRTPPANSA